MTTHPGKTTATPEQLSDLARELERLLPPGHCLVHSRRMGWLLRKWDSWQTPQGPKMAWFDVDSSTSLAELLGRLENK